MLRHPPRSTICPTRRSSDLTHRRGRHLGRGVRAHRVRWRPARKHVAASGARGAIGGHRIVRQDVPHDRLEDRVGDRKSTRLNSSHQIISYAVFCLKKKIGSTNQTLSVFPLRSKYTLNLSTSLCLSWRFW